MDLDKQTDTIAVVVGGTGGLGRAIALELCARGQKVVVTGRRYQDATPAKFMGLTLVTDIGDLVTEFSDFLDLLPRVHTLVYAPGYYQEKEIGQLTPDDIMKMHVTCDIGCELLLNMLIARQGSLETFVPITSTSARFPRRFEPSYAAAKAGLKHFAHSVSFSPSVGKTLHVAPAGMDTGFWDGTDKDRKEFLDPKWVAERVVAHLDGEFAWKSLHVDRSPPSETVMDVREK